MTEEKFIKIFENEDTDWTGDNAFQGLTIIAKYINPLENDIICGADHDVMYSVDVNELIEAGIIEEDAKNLRKLNWMITEGYLECFV